MKIEAMARLAAVAFDETASYEDRRASAWTYTFEAANGSPPIMFRCRPLLGIAVSVRRRRTYTFPIFNPDAPTLRSLTAVK
jgi:hypothetical protein